MNDDMRILREVLSEAKLIKHPSWSDYERLKRKLQNNFIFGHERELADALRL